MKRQIRIIAFLFLLIVLSAQLSFADNTPGLSNFQKVNDYVDGQFSDVTGSAWYVPNIKRSFELGLILGSSENLFNINGDIKLSETITIASRLHNTYNGSPYSFEKSSPWYQVYVDYAIENGIIKQGDYSDYTAKATRAQFANILANSMSIEAFEAINDIQKGSIPDVSGQESFAAAVYKLYNAGILSGSDKYGTFNPDNTITRKEAAAIVTRLADLSLRLNVKLEEKPVEPESVLLSTNSIIITRGETSSLTATILPQKASGALLIWSSSNEDVASVSQEGLVEAHKVGDTLITVKTENGKSATCTVSVLFAPEDLVRSAHFWWGQEGEYYYLSTAFLDDVAANEDTAQQLKVDYKIEIRIVNGNNEEVYRATQTIKKEEFEYVPKNGKYYYLGTAKILRDDIKTARALSYYDSSASKGKLYYTIYDTINGGAFYFEESSIDIFDLPYTYPKAEITVPNTPVYVIDYHGDYRIQIDNITLGGTPAAPTVTISGQRINALSFDNIHLSNYDNRSLKIYIKWEFVNSLTGELLYNASVSTPTINVGDYFTATVDLSSYYKLRDLFPGIDGQSYDFRITGIF